MVRFRKRVGTEVSIVSGLIVDSRDLFSKEKYEQNLDDELEILIQQYHKNKRVDYQQITKVVEEFMRVIEGNPHSGNRLNHGILGKLEDAKTRAEQEETRKIDKIRQL